jgi:hypothetical protein
MHAKQMFRFWPAIVIVLAAGCSDSGPTMYQVSGVATRNGHPLPGLYIRFQPDDQMKYADSAAITDAQGRFTMKVGSKPGVFPGPHTVYVGDPKSLQGGRSSTDPEYQAAIKAHGPNSTLKVEFTADANNYELKLDG